MPSTLAVRRFYGKKTGKTGRIVVLDTETTGLSWRYGDRICEVGAIEVDANFEPIKSYHVYVNPERPVSYGAEQVHGLSNDFLKKQPRFADIESEFVDFVAGAELIAHNAVFDIGFLNRELFLAGADDLETFGCTVRCSLQWARRLFPGQGNKLSDLCSRFGVSLASRTLHGALIDAELLRQVCKGLADYERTGVVHRAL